MGCTDRIERIKAALRLANRAGLTGRETTVLVELATHDFNPEHPGVVYPSLATLAEAVEIDRKHLPALLQSIAAKGCVSCVHRGGGRRNPSRYRIHYDAQPDRATRSVPRGADGRFASTAGNVPYPRDVSESAETSRATVQKRPVPRAENVPCPRDRTLRELEMGSAREESASSPPSPDSTPAGSGPGGSEWTTDGRHGGEVAVELGLSRMDWVKAHSRGMSADQFEALELAKRAPADPPVAPVAGEQAAEAQPKAPSAGTEAQPQAVEPQAMAGDRVTADGTGDTDVPGFTEDVQQQLLLAAQEIADRFGTIPPAVRAEADRRLSAMLGAPASWTLGETDGGQIALAAVARVGVETNTGKPIAVQDSTGAVTLAFMLDVDGVNAVYETVGGEHPLLPLVSRTGAGSVRPARMTSGR